MTRAFRYGLAVLIVGLVGVRSEAIDQARYVRNAQGQIDHLTEEFHKIEAKVSHLESDRRTECQETLGHLWKKERLARVKLEEIRHASPSQWQTIRKEEDSILIHLQKSYRHLMNRYFK